jgi:hypothetical protein
MASPSCLASTRDESPGHETLGLVYRTREGIAWGMDGALVPLKPQARVILLHTLVAGEVRRGEFAALTGCSERSTRTALSQLLEEGLLCSDTPKGAVRNGFPPHSLSYRFPDLVPSPPES